MRVILITVFMLVATATYAGSITYEIVDYSSVATGHRIGSGTLVQSPNDVRVVKQEGRGLVLWSKSVFLAHGFSIGLSDARDADLTGFGMWVQTDPDRFSWDWFTRSHGDIFDKIRETGSVRVTTKRSGGAQEIRSVEFVTDVSLRQLALGSGGKVLCRVNIKKGSVFDILP